MMKVIKYKFWGLEMSEISIFTVTKLCEKLQLMCQSNTSLFLYASKFSHTSLCLEFDMSFRWLEHVTNSYTGCNQVTPISVHMEVLSRLLLLMLHK